MFTRALLNITNRNRLAALAALGTGGTMIYSNTTRTNNPERERQLRYLNLNSHHVHQPHSSLVAPFHRTTTRIENLDKGRPPMMMAELRPLATSKDYDDATDFEVAKTCLLVFAISSYKIFETVWWYYDYESWYYMNHEPEDYCLETLERIEADKAAYTAQATEQRKRATQHGNMPAKSTTIITFPTKNMDFWINVLNEPAKLKDVEQKILYRHHYLDHGFFASSFVQYSCQVQITDVKVSSNNEVNVTYDATYKVTDDEQTEAIVAHNSETKSATTLYSIRFKPENKDYWEHAMNEPAKLNFLEAMIAVDDRVGADKERVRIKDVRLSSDGVDVLFELTEQKEVAQVAKSEKCAEVKSDQEAFTEQTTEQTPKQTPKQTPEQIPEQTPKQTPEQIPEQTPKQMPEQIPEQTPEQTTEQTTEQTPEQTPEQTAGLSHGLLASDILQLEEELSDAYVFINPESGQPNTIFGDLGIKMLNNKICKEMTLNVFLSLWEHYGITKSNGEYVLDTERMMNGPPLPTADAVPFGIANLASLADIDNDGEITFVEFVRAFTVCNLAVMEEKHFINNPNNEYRDDVSMDIIYRTLDLNNDGKISKKELGIFVRRLEMLSYFLEGDEYTTVESLMASFDVNKDGFISKEEFMEMCSYIDFSSVTKQQLYGNLF
jgi:Ca2+-binding EF-hand superfamily protein